MQDCEWQDFYNKNYRRPKKKTRIQYDEKDLKSTDQMVAEML